MSIILSSLYNAPIQYYTKLILGKPIVLDVYEYYVKQSYRNRCLIYAADGVMPLSIPVNYNSKQAIKDVTISYQSNWVHLHWNAIVSAYNSTPFFEYYRDTYEKAYTSKAKYLVDFNNELLAITLSFLKVKDQIDLTNSSEFISAKHDNDEDYRELISPKKDIKDSLFQSKKYYQVFAYKSGFIGNLSILDLLFNMGNESILILQNSINNNTI